MNLKKNVSILLITLWVFSCTEPGLKNASDSGNSPSAKLLPRYWEKVDSSRLKSNILNSFSNTTCAINMDSNKKAAKHAAFLKGLDKNQKPNFSGKYLYLEVPGPSSKDLLVIDCINGQIFTPELVAVNKTLFKKESTILVLNAPSDDETNENYSPKLCGDPMILRWKVDHFETVEDKILNYIQNSNSNF